jgi:DNA-binding protein H-NS
VLKSGITPDVLTNAKTAQAVAEDEERSEEPQPAPQVSSRKTWKGR